MRAVERLFRQKNPYDMAAQGLFLPAVRENLQFQWENCAQYRRIAEEFAFTPEVIRTEEDLWRLPLLPSLYFKKNEIFTLPYERLMIRATSSGTQGSRSRIGFDRASFYRGLRMVWRMFRFHGVLSACPTNYIMLGYEPGEGNDMGAVKTAYGASFFAPPLHRAYALRRTADGEYRPDMEGVGRALARYAKAGLPVRFLGFPAYMYFLAAALRENGVRLRLHPQSKILLGGGWKQFSDREIPREAFYALIEETTGIGRENVLEFFSAVEHPVAYCKCRRGHFHVPVYSRVLIRDVRTLAPLGFDEPGILSFVTPLVGSMPLLSVSTDDLAVLRAGGSCGCGIETPYFELLGRAGVAEIQTCSQGAAQKMGG